MSWIISVVEGGLCLFDDSQLHLFCSFALNIPSWAIELLLKSPSTIQCSLTFKEC